MLDIEIVSVPDQAPDQALFEHTLANVHVHIRIETEIETDRALDELNMSIPCLNRSGQADNEQRRLAWTVHTGRETELDAVLEMSGMGLTDPAAATYNHCWTTR